MGRIRDIFFITAAALLAASNKAASAQPVEIELKVEAQRLEAQLNGASDHTRAKIHAGARSVLDRLADLLPSVSPGYLHEWAAAVQIGFQAECLSDSRSFALTNADLLTWWEIVESSPLQKKEDLCLLLATAVLARWTSFEPAASLELFKSSTSKYYAGASHSARSDWQWSSRVWLHNFYCSSARLPAQESAAIRQSVDGELRRLWADEAIPLKQRTISVVWRARSAYAENRPEEAAAFLDHWRARHAGQIDAIEFFELRFFVAWLGEGKTEVAREMLRNADALVQAGSISETNSDYILMTQSFYRYLACSDMERLRVLLKN